MKINTIPKILIVFLFLTWGVSCVKDTDYELPEITISIPKFDGVIKNITDIVSVTTNEVTEYKSNDALQGYVISSDESGNFYKKIYIENADKTHGFTIALDKGGLYSEFPLGAKVQIRLKGLSTQLVDDQLEIGYKTYTSKNGRVSVGTIPPTIYKNHLYNLQEDLKSKEALAIETSIKDLNKKENLNKLITLKKVHFENSVIGKTFYKEGYSDKNGTNYKLVDSENKNIIFRTSKYAKFKDERVPDGLLNVTGILTKYGSTYQFMISNPDDIVVVGEIPNSNTTSPTTSGDIKTISEISKLYKGSDIIFSENFVIKGVVISENKNGNTNIKNAVIQDDTAGIILRFESPHNLDFGKEVEVSLKGNKLSEKYGLLQIEVSPSNIKLGTKTNPIPKILTIAEINTGKYQNQWVKIENVQFKEIGKKYSEENSLTDCTNELPIYVNKKYASFKDEIVSNQKGYIEGYISLFKGKPQFIINTTSDIHFTENYKDCSASTGGNPSTGVTTPTTTVNNKFNFEDIRSEDISNSYTKEGTLTSSDGKVTLSFKARTDVDEYPIEGKGIMMKNNGFIKIIFSEGIKTLKFKYRGAYTTNKKRKVIVLEGDESSNTVLKEKEFAHDITPETLSLNLNKTGTYTVTIKGGTDKQIVIDDIEWTN